MIFMHSLKFPVVNYNFLEQSYCRDGLNRTMVRAYIDKFMPTMETSLKVQSSQTVEKALTPNQKANLLVQELKSGCEKSFEQLYEMFSKKIFNLCYRMFNSYEEASDLTQEIFIKVYRSIDNFRGDSNFYTWLYTIALNTCRNRKEKVSRIARLETKLGTSEDGQDLIDSLFADPRTSEHPTHRLESEELRAWVADGISRLPTKYSEILIMKDINAMNYQEIAEVLECSLGTVKSRLNRARTMLKEKLESSRNVSEMMQKRGGQ